MTRVPASWPYSWEQKGSACDPLGAASPFPRPQPHALPPAEWPQRLTLSHRWLPSSAILVVGCGVSLVCISPGAHGRGRLLLRASGGARISSGGQSCWVGLGRSAVELWTC